MKIVAFYPCEQVIHRWSGAMDILNLGIHGGLSLQGGPMGHYLMVTVLVWLHFVGGETGDVAVQVPIVDADGHVIYDPPGVVQTVTGPETMWTFPVAALIPAPGDYEIRLVINRRIETGYPLCLSFADRPNGAGSAS